MISNVGNITLEAIEMIGNWGDFLLVGIRYMLYTYKLRTLILHALLRVSGTIEKKHEKDPPVVTILAVEYEWKCGTQLSEFSIMEVYEFKIIWIFI